MGRIQPRKISPGDKVAIVSPSFAAPGAFRAVHERAMERLREDIGLVPVEYPTTRELGAAPKDRARDVNAALADPEIRAILSTIGGEDQVRVIPYLDPSLLRDHPKIFLGYSDNTSLHNWFWQHGVQSFYGGSTQVHLGPGPDIDPEHLLSLRAALFDGAAVTLTNPPASEDFGIDWHDARALSEHGAREPSEPWVWAGPERRVTGGTWGGCIEVLDWICLAGRFPAVESLDGAILLLETSEELPSAQMVRWWVRGMGERGLLNRVSGILLARPPVSSHGIQPDAQARAQLRADQYNAVIREARYYNPDLVICCGVPFGHTKPQWIVPYGGTITLDAPAGEVVADYS